MPFIKKYFSLFYNSLEAFDSYIKNQTPRYNEEARYVDILQKNLVNFYRNFKIFYYFHVRCYNIMSKYCSFRIPF